MASRHDIIHIDFQANAGKANKALQALQDGARNAKNEVDRLRNELANARSANFPVNQIQQLESELKKAQKESKQWSSALQANMKGVRALDEAVKMFNKGKGSVEGMNAAMSKVAYNAAELQKKRSNEGSKTWKEMDALMVALQQNIYRANTSLNSLVTNIKNGGTTSKSTLTQAKSDLQQMIAMEDQGSKGWQKYTAQLKTVENELKRVTMEEQRMAGKQTLGKAFRGDFATADKTTLEQTIQKLREYQSVINDPKGSGKRHFAAAEAQIQKLQATLDVLKQKTAEASGQAMSFRQAMQVGLAAGSGKFKGTVADLNLAKKTLEELQQKAVKGGLAWRRMQESIDRINMELKQTVFISNDVQKVLDKPKGRSFNELKQAVEQGRAALQNMRTTTDKEKKAFDELAKKVKTADEQMKALGSNSRGTASAFDKAWSRLKTYVGLYVGAAVAMQKLTATMSDLMELSDKMGEVRKTTGFTADEVGRLAGELKKMDTRTSITGLLDLSVAAGQLGLKTQEDVLGFTEAANKLMVALPEMGKEGATEMLKVALATGEIDKIRKQMDQGLIEGSSATAVAMEKVGSTIDRLRATSAATAPAITDFVKRVGAVGAQSGITIDQVAALGSTVDALGMRVEMSATALSRMIPAIKNNAFDVAKVIGVTPDTLRNLFDTGRGMEAILMIFQHIKDSNMSEDSIENMLGMGNMKEIMKELNQMGARAGIVFSGLSQNVDELRRQLGVAGEAYQQNIAIQQEYDKMNETTAAKWERLKNQVEEMFVGDQAQRFLGSIIEGIRNIIDILSGPLRKSLLTITFLWGVFKLGVGEGFARGIVALKNFGSALLSTKVSVDSLRTSWSKLEATTKQNIWGALIAAMGMVIYKVIEWKKAINEARKEIGKWAQQVLESERAVEKNFQTVDKARLSIEEANKKLKEARAALDKAKESMDSSKESADKLAQAEKDLKKAEEDVTVANDAHRAGIEQINKLYGSYLGFMLSEISSAAELANARELINSKLRETITLKRKEAALGRVEENSGEGRDQAYGLLSQSLSGAIRKQVDIGGGKKEWATDEKATAELLRQITKVAQDVSLTRKEAAEKIDKILVGAGKSGDTWESWRASIRNRALEYQKEYRDVEKKVKDVETQFDIEMQIDREESQKRLDKQYQEADKTYARLEQEHANAQGEAKKKAAANLLKQSDSLQDMVNNAKNYYDLTNESEKEAYDKFVSDSQARIDGIEKQRKDLLKEAGKYYSPVKGSAAYTTHNGGGGNIWGSNASADSTDYSLFDVNELVARRNQMDKLKNILKPDTDVRAVLAEDKALMKALDNGLQADWKSVLNWYNQERKKIQEELKSERFSTNEGHWRDEKKGKGRKNPLVESDYALAELDRYYSRRKEALEKARTEENVSEELFNRQAELLEQEHLKKRSELRETFTAGNTEQEKRMVKQFREWWKQLEKSGDLDEVPWATVESEWNKATAAQIGRNNLKAQQDLTQMQHITVKHLNAIAKIIDKERPYGGITANLRDNLTKMDILFADMDKANADALGRGEGRKFTEADYVKAGTERLKFLLGEAENAYSTTVEDVLRRMGESGMKALADEISNSDAMKNALMAQLQTAYDEIQNAIKKEASLIKKQTDIWWADVMPGQTESRKGGFERMLSSLGLSEDQVKRANSLIGAGQASERVADKLAIKQMQVRLAMQETYYNRMRQIGMERIAQLKAAGKLEDAEHLQKSLNLSLAEEQKKLDEQRVAIANQLEESQNRLYTELREWASLLSGGLQSLFEASHAGDAEYYNERAKMNLTGRGGPGAGTYIVIDNEGTEDASAHYEYLNERQALERQHEIEQYNAQAEAWKKVMDDINMKMSETITDQMNAMLQNASIDANTDATASNTEAIVGLTGVIAGITGGDAGLSGDAGIGTSGLQAINPTDAQEFTGELGDNPMGFWVNASDAATQRILQNQQLVEQGALQTDKKMAASSQSTFAKMTQAANLYGIAYQAMSNDNLSTTQKFEMIAVQAAGQAAISALTASLAQNTGQVAADTPAVASKAFAQLGPIAGPAAFAVLTALLGGLLGMAVSKIAKSKSQIAQVTGTSVGAGRLSTGMLTYAEGNVNEFTDPSSLTPGRQYNVDAADGKTYRARYMGSRPRTHITNGPEFHLSGEKGREMIIDANTTRQITMNDGEIWRTIQTLSGGGRLRRSVRRGRGVSVFADGNVNDFMDLPVDDGGASGGMSPEQMASLQASIDRQSDLLDRALTEGIKGVFSVSGPDGLVASYDKGKREALRHGERYP